MDRKDELIAVRRVPILLTVATFDQADIFFRSLVRETRDELDELGWMAPSIEKAANRALDETMHWGEAYGRIQRFFQKVLEENIRVVFILDEFDAARQLFHGDQAGFQALRELAYRPEWRVTLITTSRRSIRTIEAQAPISTLDGIFQKHYLGMFSPDDVALLRERLEASGVAVNDDLKTKIEWFCGRHPFLLERLAFALVEQRRTAPITDFSSVQRDLSPEFVDHYEKTVALLRDEGRLTKLLQILFGPVVDATQVDVEDLLRYGLIQSSDDNRYRAFSAHFEQFLQLQTRQFDLWPIWSQTERELRSVLTQFVVERFGNNWPDKLRKARPNLEKMIEMWQSNQAKEHTTFGARASTNLLDFTYPLDLFEIMKTDWNWFRPVFGGQANDWRQAFETLSRVRTPLAHNRDATIYESDRLKAQGICRDILDRVTAWRASSG